MRRNAAMKKACIFAMLLGFSGYVMAQEQTINRNGFNLFWVPSVGLLHGHAEEIVYYEKGSDDKISQLLWNMKPLVYGGIDINFDWLNPESNWGLFVDSSFKVGFTAKTGPVEDRDWAGQNRNGAWLPDVLTHYSVHDNNTDKALLIDAAIGVSFEIFRKYLLRAYIAYDYMTFAWTADGGSFLYPAEDIDRDGYLEQQHFYVPSGTTVGTYAQEWKIVSPGVSFYGKFNRFFDIDVSLKLSPLIWCTTTDEHRLRNLVIEGSMDSGFFVEPKLVFSFTPNDLFALSLAVSYTGISGTRGDPKYTEQGSRPITYQDTGGSGYSAFDIGLLAKAVLLAD
jgi:outer membrane protease